MAMAMAMAMRCSSSSSSASSPSTFMIIPKRFQLNKPFSSRLLMFTKPQSRHQTPLLLQINSSSFNNIVFEDPCNGIICHIDDNGDMICEGYDEGPRLNHQQLATFTYGDTKIIDMLQRSWLKVADKENVAAHYSTPVDSPN